MIIFSASTCIIARSGTLAKRPATGHTLNSVRYKAIFKHTWYYSNTTNAANAWGFISSIQAYCKTFYGFFLVARLLSMLMETAQKVPITVASAS
jgi:hypothetical protein